MGCETETLPIMTNFFVKKNKVPHNPTWKLHRGETRYRVISKLILESLKFIYVYRGWSAIEPVFCDDFLNNDQDSLKQKIGYFIVEFWKQNIEFQLHEEKKIGIFIS
jgi:hypothetical protein